MNSVEPDAARVSGTMTSAPAFTGGPAPVELISAYAAELRQSLANRSDVDDLVDEVLDHLLESATRLQQGGMDAAAAARESLDRFGDQELVARAYRSTSSGGTAMPTTLTRVAGVAGLFAAAAMTVFALMEAVSTARVLDLPGSSGGFSDRAWSMIGVAMFVPTLVLVVGVAARTGVAHGPWLAVVGAPLAVATVLFATMWWAYPFWGTCLSLGALAVAVRARRLGLEREGGSTWPLWLLALAWPLGTAVFFVLERIALGPVDAYGGHVLAFFVSSLVVAAQVVPAAARLGWWMAREATPSRQHTLPLAPV